MSLLIALQVQAAANETIKPGAVLLAQSAGPQKEPKSPGAAGAQEEEKLKQKTRDQEMLMEKQAPRTRGMQRPPAAAGTRKVGGQTIRGKESLEGE